jgi:hypothetical protein
MAFDHKYEGKRIVLLVGNLTQEGVTTKISALGYDYQQKLFFSKPENWLSISELLASLRESDELVAVFIHFTQAAIYRAAHAVYRDVWKTLLQELTLCNTFVFVYAENLSGKFSYNSARDGPYGCTVSDSEFMQIIGDLYENKVEVIPYTRRTELTIRIQQALDEIEGGVFFRLYVPNGRIQSEQLSSLLRLLENYLQRVEQISFSYDQRKTEHGTIYEFKSKDGSIVSVVNLEGTLSRFEDFMNLVENDFAAATKYLESLNIAPTKAIQLINKYSRDYRRLKLDIKHDYESRILALRQRLESEVLELNFGGNLLVADDTIHPSTILNPSLRTNEITINIQSTSIHDSSVINAEIAQLIQGDYTEPQKLDHELRWMRI